MIRRSLALSVCALALVVAGCGNREPETTRAETEGIWLDVGALDYHIQGSRQLNPSEVPDDRYVAGLPSSYKAPTGNETYFAVFLRIENKTDASAPTASDFEIEDTEGDVYTPIPLDTQLNAFAYQPQTLGSAEAMPAPDSTQESDAAAGSMLLFKLPLTSYQNRPLELKIKSPDGKPEEGSVDLDV